MPTYPETIVPYPTAGYTTGAIANIVALNKRYNAGLPWVDVVSQTGWDPIASNNDSAVLTALTAAFNAGGGPVLLPHRLKISNRLVVPHSVDLIGLGALPGAYAQSEILCTAAGSGVSFGLDTAYMGVVGSGGGMSRGFTVNGNGVATNAMRCAIGTRSYFNIEITGSVQDGLILAATQNSLFMQVNVNTSGRDNYVLDYGAGGNHFVKCENHTPGRSYLTFQATAAGGGGVAYPLYNVFDNMIMEYNQASSGPLVQHAAGQFNQLVNCQVTSQNGLTTMATPAMIRVAADYTGSPSQLLLHNTVVLSSAQPALRAFDIGANSTLALSGICTAGGMGIAIKAVGAAIIQDSGLLNTSTLVAPATRVEGSDSGFVRVYDSRIQCNRGTGDVVLQTLVPGEAVARVSLYGDGITNYSSGSAAPDVNWRRTGAGRIGTDFKVVAVQGIGVGNSAAATTPGTVVKKMEVFDASGNSLGFVPIYSSIT